MKLSLLRHAKTDPKSFSGKDFDRCLLPRGMRQSQAMAEHLKRAGMTPEKIYCSTAKRTRETCQHIFHSFKELPTEFIDDLYLCEKNTLLQYICKETDTLDMLIIGHNDGISNLASYLTNDYIHLKTCELVVLEFFINDWKEVSNGTAKISYRYRPDVY